MKEPSPFEVAPREPGEKAGVFKKRREKAGGTS
ncbi:peptide chain release factor 2 [Mobiluncus mulieris]|nr:peptide chain release factor 2 [Mobiluncus mulieris]